MMAKRYFSLRPWRTALGVCAAFAAFAAHGADYPAPQEGSWIAKDFRFHTGQVLAELRIHYVTVGAATGEPVLILHGEDDRVVPLQEAKTLAGFIQRHSGFWIFRISRSQAVLVPEHAMDAEDNAALEAFLRQRKLLKR